MFSAPRSIVFLLALSLVSACSAQIAYNTTYTCNGGSNSFQVLSCKGTGAADFCSVQLLNSGARDGKGALLDMYRSMVMDNIRHCVLPAGTVVSNDSRSGAASPLQHQAAPSSAPSRFKTSIGTPQTASTTAAPAAGGDCRGALQPGSAVEARWRTSWYPAKIVACKGADYVVQYNMDKSEETVDATRVRTSAPAPAASANALGSVRSGHYSCSAFMGTPPYGHLQPMPGITITGPASYRHDTGGSTGAYSYSGGTVSFRGGNLDKQAARYEIDGVGRAILRLFNESRSRTVIDCEGPK